MSEITVVEEKTLIDIHEMADTVAVKGKLLREIIDELLALRRAHAELARDQSRLDWLEKRRHDASQNLDGSYSWTVSFRARLDTDRSLRAAIDSAITGDRRD